ncbi:MAG: WD40 repeat domain-containing protein [Elusimicrobia bacterium]|nr:WD40 repeat domain-containing protein [Elusimicrobiota bacterium]
MTTASSGLVEFIDMIERIFRLLAPALAVSVQLYYIHQTYCYLYLHQVYNYLYIISEKSSTTVALLFIIPLILLEFAATGLIDIRRHGYKKNVLFGLALRCLFFTVIGLAVFWYPVKARDSVNVFAALAWRWYEAVKIIWLASPIAGALWLLIIAALYIRLVVRKGLYRLTVTIIIPSTATISLFLLLYFYPASPLRRFHSAPPAGLENIFPSKDNIGLQNQPWLKETFFPHDLYVHPQDKWAAVSMGPTFSSEKYSQPKFLWIDLHRNSGSAAPGVGGYADDNKKFQAFDVGGSQVRRFDTQCPEKIYFSSWHKSALFEYIPGSSSLKRISLPEKAGGWPVRELFSVYHDCSSKKVYIANNVNPVLFVYDARRNRLDKTIAFAGAEGMWQTTHIFVVKPNPLRKSLLLSMYGKYSLIELDEKTFEIKNKIKTWDLRNGFFDIAVSPDGKYIYAPSAFRGIIFKFDAENFNVLKRIKAPPHCRTLKFSTDGQYFFAGSYLTGEVLVYDAATDKKILSFYVMPRIEAVFATAGYLYIIGNKGLFRISNDRLHSMQYRPNSK